MERYRSDLKQLSRELRATMTDAEQRLWQKIRGRQICGATFYRQKPLLSFIVDFYCPKAKLVIELDGSQHYDAPNCQRDAARDAALGALGLRVLRFDDRQVLLETDSVLALIHDVVFERTGGDLKKSPPTPLFQRGEVGRHGND